MCVPIRVVASFQRVVCTDFGPEDVSPGVCTSASIELNLKM